MLPLYLFLDSKLKSKLITERPTFRSTPFTEVVMPVTRVKFCFAAVIPRALFQLKPNFPKKNYLLQVTKNIQSRRKGIFFDVKPFVVIIISSLREIVDLKTIP